MNAAKRYERSTKGLRDLLFDALDRVLDNQMKPAEASQIANVVKQIVATADLELRVQKQMRELSEGDADAIVLAPPVVMLSRDAGSAD